MFLDLETIKISSRKILNLTDKKIYLAIYQFEQNVLNFINFSKTNYTLFQKFS